MRQKSLLFQTNLIFSILLFSASAQAFQVEYILSDSPKYSEPGFITLEKLFEINNDGGDKYYIFRGSDIAADPAGNIYIIDYMSTENYVRKFDKNGKYVASFSPHGQGPNELQNPRTLQIADNKLHIYQRGMGVKALDYEGNYSHSNVFSRGIVSWFATSGATYIYLSYFSLPERPGLERFVLNNVNINSGDIKEIIEIQSTNTEDSGFYIPYTAATNSKVELFFAPTGDEYKILKYDFEGNLLLEFGRKYNRIPYSKEAKERFTKNRGTLVQQGAPPQAKYPAIVKNILIDSNDNIWVNVGAWKFDYHTGPATVDIFNREGEFLYTFETDKIGVMSKIYNNKLYSLPVPDDDGNQIISVYQIIYSNKN